MDERTTGYSLLGAGLLVMLVSVLIVIFVFLGAIKPIQFFNIQAPSFNTSDLIPQMPGAPAGKSFEPIPSEAFNQSLNLTITFFLMTFIMSFGFKLADLGVKLIRPIKIQAKTVS